MRLADEVANVVTFVPRVAMVKLEYGKIANAAIHALCVAEEIAQSLAVFRLRELVVGCRASFVGLRIAAVIHPREARHAHPAAGLTFAPRTVFEREVRQIEDVATQRAPS